MSLGRLRPRTDTFGSCRAFTCRNPSTSLNSLSRLQTETLRLSISGEADKAPTVVLGKPPRKTSDCQSTLRAAACVWKAAARLQALRPLAYLQHAPAKNVVMVCVSVKISATKCPNHRHRLNAGSSRYPRHKRSMSPRSPKAESWSQKFREGCGSAVCTRSCAGLRVGDPVGAPMAWMLCWALWGL